VAGIYVHIPFCRKRCTYCDFHFSTTFSSYRDELISAIIHELDLRKKEIVEPVDTIYFGGGTPSLLTEFELSSIMDRIHQSFRISQSTEITLEVNPEDVTFENVSVWKNCGINRISMGLQSFKESDLKWMNRAHDCSQGFGAVELLKNKAFDNISVDLIYGLPELTLSEWEQHLQHVIALDVQHLSAYCLTVEKGTTLNHFVKIGKLKTQNEDTQSEQFNLMLRILNKNNYFQYEISNFSKPGFESKHNTSYWRNKPYLGVGPSAHSFAAKTRRWNVSNNTSYYKNVGKNDSWFETEFLSKNDLWNELFLTGLRTIWGVSKSELDNLSTLTNSEKKNIDSLKESEDLFETQTAYILTEKGRLKADGIAASFFRIPS
jgi:oxygen-independent coproporphyrinogen-3 oxidase